MRRLALVLALVSCAHSAPEPEAEAAPVESRNLQLSADVTAPVRESCRSKGPRLAARDRPIGKIIVDYQVTAEGRVRDVAVQGEATERAISAVRRYLEGCRYTPATRNGQPVAVQWKGELSFRDTIRNSVPKPR